MSVDIPPHRLIYESVALTRRVTCVLHCTVQQHPSKRLSQSFYNNLNYWKPWMAKIWSGYKSKVYELTYKLLSTVNISKNNFRPRRWQSLSERGSDKRYEEREVNWQNQLWDTFHTTPRGQSCELLGTYLSWMSESRSWRLARKIPPYERLAQDTQCKIELLRLIRGEIQRVYVSHETLKWSCELAIAYAFWES